MNRFSVVFISLIGVYCTQTLAVPWQPAKGSVQIPLWPDAPPEGHTVKGAEDSGNVALANAIRAQIVLYRSGQPSRDIR